MKQSTASNCLVLVHCHHRVWQVQSFLGVLTFISIHYFDAHRLQPLLLQAPALQIHLRASHLAGPEGAGEAVEDPSSDEERATTDGESEVEAVADDADPPPEEPWCPPIPDAPDDPTEIEMAGAADKLATMR